MSTYEDKRDVDVDDDLDHAGDKLDDMGDKVEHGARNLGDKIHDTVEDAIPGDSDHDGH